MLENTNKAIFVNSIILYAKMGITTICALLSTRFALQALGIVDFGLYSVLGGIISFIGIFNTIMLSTSDRYLAVSIGKGDIAETNKVFNVNFAIFLAISLLMLLVAYPLGHWYIYRYVNYNGDISNAMMVFLISMLGSIVSALGTPYNGLLIAKEKFIVFSVLEVIAHIVRLAITYSLIYFFTDKLFIYTIALSVLAAMPAIVEFWYCRKHYYEMVKFKFVKDKALFKEIFCFSGWVSYGAVACIAKSQGAALLVNAFYDTVMNTALGLANNIGAYIGIFAQNVAQPMVPQITKSYASDNKERTNELLVLSTKYSFLLMLLVGSVFLVAPEWVLHLWLGEVPPYAVSFTVLVVIDYLIGSFNSGISSLIFASGKIKCYQLLINTTRVLSIVVAFLVLKAGFPATSLLITYIVFSIIIVALTQMALCKTLKFNNILLFKSSYFPSFLVLLLFLPVLFLRHLFSPVLLAVISILYLLALVICVGLNKTERKYLLSKIQYTVKHKYKDEV